MGQFLKKIIQYKHEGFREEKNINIEKLIKDKMLITEQLQKCDKNSKNYLNLQNVLNKIELNINEINEKNINDIDKFIIYVKKALIIFNKNSKNANILLSLIKDNLNKNKYKQKNNEKPKEVKQHDKESYTDNSKIVQTTKNKRKKIKVFYYDEEEEIEKFEWKYEDEVIEYSDEVEELEEISSPYISDKSIDYVKHDEDD